MQKVESLESDALAASQFKVRNLPDPFGKRPAIAPD
jgi:hypothetical protein